MTNRPVTATATAAYIDTRRTAFFRPSITVTDRDPATNVERVLGHTDIEDSEDIFDVCSDVLGVMGWRQIGGARGLTAELEPGYYVVNVERIGRI